MSSLLPPNATASERALEGATARIDSAPVSVSELWRPDTCPALALPWLAWALSVDVWDATWSESVKRSVIAKSIEIHRHKGTVWAVREALRAGGYAEATLSEGFPRLNYDGSQLYDAGETYYGGSRWALFDVRADIGEDVGIDTASRLQLASLIDMAKPVSRHLRAITFTSTTSDTATISEAATMAAHDIHAEVLPWGVRYDGTVLHDSGRALAYDGTDTFAGGISYTMAVAGTRQYDNAWESTTLAARATATDQQSATMHYNGLADYDGLLDMGATTAPLRDAKMTITTRRHWLHNGRRTYGSGKEYDGDQAFDGVVDYTPQCTYAGIHIIQEVRV